jgi:V/A-type H+-transporting ATPase subunit I
MLVPRRIAEVVIVTPSQDFDKVVAGLAREGLMHPEAPPPEFKGRVEREYLNAYSVASEYAGKLESFFRVLGVEPRSGKEVSVRASNWLEALEKVIERFRIDYEAFERGVSSLVKMEERINELVSLKAALEPISDVDADVREAQEAAKIGYIIGYMDVEEEEAEALARDLAARHGVVVAVERRGDTVVVSVAGEKAGVHKSYLDLRQRGFTPVSIPPELPGSPAEAYREVSESIKRLHEESERLRSRLLSAADDMYTFYSAVASLRDVFKLLSNTGRTRTTSVIRGYIDQADLGRLRKILEEATKGSYVLQVVSIRRGEYKVPTKIKLPRFLRPFHMVVQVYGEPDPDEIVPTIFVAVMLPVMFALMFPDAGHGLLVVLFALGYMMKRSRDWGILAAILGSSSIVSGFLAGEVFGPLVSEKIGLYSFWKSMGFDHPPLAPPTFAAEAYPEGDPRRASLALALFYQAMTIALWMGGFILAMGSFLGVVDAYLKRDMQGLVLAKLPRFLFFLSVSSPFFLYFDVTKSGSVLSKAIFEMGGGDPLATFVLYGSIMGLAWLFLGSIVEYRLHGENPLHGAGRGLLEVYENLLMAVGNIPSFLRILALALAHTSLMLGFTEIYKIIADGPAATVAAVFVYILGNLLAAGLEGILAFAHSIRLHFYEWFSKFYGGTGVEFRPVEMRGINVVLP